MNEPLDPFHLAAYVDGELSLPEARAVEQALASQPAAAAEVAALRAQRSALHARYDALLSAPHRLVVGERVAPRSRRGIFAWARADSRMRFGGALAATLVVGCAIGLVGGWTARGQRTLQEEALVAARHDTPLDAFVRTAARSHAVFVPEQRHPVEVAAADEAHLVAWLSKRLDAPITVPHIGDAGWRLLGGRLLPAEAGPVAQFMYEDARGRRLTLAVTRPLRDENARRPADPETAFRIAHEGDETVFYWIDQRFAYALTGRLTRPEMTAVADRVYRQLDR